MTQGLPCRERVRRNQEHESERASAPRAPCGAACASQGPKRSRAPRERRRWKSRGVPLGREKEDVFPSAAARRGLESALLREISQLEKDRCHLISLVCGI